MLSAMILRIIMLSFACIFCVAAERPIACFFTQFVSTQIIEKLLNLFLKLFFRVPRQTL